MSDEIRRDDKVPGWLFYSVWRGEVKVAFADLESSLDTGVWHLSRIYVERDYRREGIGSRLMQRMVADVPQIYGHIEQIGPVRVSKRALEWFYRKNGAHIRRGVFLSWGGDMERRG